MWVHNCKYGLWFIPEYWWWGERVYIRRNAEWWGTAHKMKNMENEVIWDEMLHILRHMFIYWKRRNFKWFSWGAIFICQQTGISGFVLGFEQRPTSLLSASPEHIAASAALGASRGTTQVCLEKNWSCPRGILCQVHGNSQKTSEQLQGSLKTDCDVNVNPCDSSYATSSNHLRRRKIFLWFSLFTTILI